MQHEAAGAVGVLGQPGLRSRSGRRAPPAGRRRCPRWGSAAEQAGASVSPYTSLDERTSGSSARGTFEQRAAAPRPTPGVDVEQHRARGVGDVGDVQPAAGQLPDQPGIDGAEGELAALGPVARAGHVVEHPGDLGAGEVGVDDQAGLARGSSGSRPSRLQPRRRAAAVRRSCQTMALWIGCAGRAVPDHGGLALVGDADGGDVAGGEAGARQGLAGDGELRVARSPAGRARPSRGAGKICRNSRCADGDRRRRSSKTMARELVVPWSRARTWGMGAV